jgi:hypothetical protein
MIAWLTFGSTVLLLGVTAWYAVLTRSLAISARDSARSAQAAAESAAQSVAATIASVKVKFHAAPMYHYGDFEGSSLGVTLVCTGATVFVHEVRVLEAMRSTFHGADHEELNSVIDDDDGHPMVADATLPLRMHNGETLFLELEPKLILLELISIASLRVQVSYSLDGTGDGIQREVEWYGKYGRDYESHA